MTKLTWWRMHLRMCLWCSAFFRLRSLRKVSRKPKTLNTVLFLFPVDTFCPYDEMGQWVKMVDKEVDRFWFLVRSSCQWRWSCQRRMLLNRRRLLPWPGPGKARNWLCPSESWFLCLIINLCRLVCLWAPVACKLKQFILQIGAHCVCVCVYVSLFSFFHVCFCVLVLHCPLHKVLVTLPKYLQAWACGCAFRLCFVFLDLLLHTFISFVFVCSLVCVCVCRFSLSVIWTRLFVVCVPMCVCVSILSLSCMLDPLSCVCVCARVCVRACVCVCADMQSPWCRWTTGSASHHQGGSVSAATSPPTSGSTSLMVPFCAAGASLTALGATTMRWSIIRKPSTHWLSNWAPSHLTERVSVRGCLWGGEGGCFNGIMIAVKTVTSKWWERKFIVQFCVVVRHYSTQSCYYVCVCVCKL